MSTSDVEDSAGMLRPGRTVASLRERVAASALRVAPEVFGAVPARGEVVETYIDGDALVLDIELDLPSGADCLRVPRLVEDEVAATIARPGQAVWCRVHWNIATMP
jgi:hypothetical protein